MTIPVWVSSAACAGSVALMFDPDRVDEALALCRRCDHVEACRELLGEVKAAAWQGVPVKGVWAGLTEDDRKRRRGPSKPRTTQQRERDELRARIHNARPRELVGR